MRPFSQASENNKAPILEILQRFFANTKHVLEIGSGTGQHAVYFSQNLPHLIWQSSDREENIAGINLWIDDAENTNIARPVLLDVCQSKWPDVAFDGVYSANTAHIMPADVAFHMIKQVGERLPVGGVFVLYGPFNYCGEYTSESNKRFDAWLKDNAPHQGIRDFEAVNEMAISVGLELVEDNEMPANNRCLVWCKSGV